MMSTIVAGTETQVNTHISEAQTESQITALDGGGWVVTWRSDNQDGSGVGIYQQAYSADGTRQGDETQVNSFVAGDQLAQQITALDGGGWVVAWTSINQDGDSWGIYQQAYDPDGTPLGEETRVNTFTSNQQRDPQTTALDGGGWVVTWQSSGQDGDGYGIYQQAYGANGTPLGDETKVNTFATGNQAEQQVATLAGGGWVVTWSSGGQDGDGFGIYQQAYGADGTRQGEETQVNTTTTGPQTTPQITALNDGGWVVAWYGHDGDGWGTYQQAYDDDGTPRGEEIRVNTTTTGSQIGAQITALDDGGWVVTWQSSGQDGDDYGIYQQAYAANGTAQGEEIQVNSFVTGDQLSLQITALDGGGWVVTWQSSGQDGDGYGVYQQAYGADGTAQGDEIQVNSFAASVQFAQQITALDGGGWVVAWQSNGQDGDGYGVFQRVFDLKDAPEGADTTITIAEDTAYTFAASDFAFTDIEGDAFSAVIITTLPSSGKLKLDGAAVMADQSIAVDDLDGLVWKPARNANGDGLATLTFQVVDEGSKIADGGDTDQSANTITFNVTDVADRLVGNDKGGTLKGTGDDDILRGRQGDDILLGKTGDDNLRSVGGNDTLKGGNGADTFVFSTGSDKDTIVDFATGVDLVDLSKWKAIEDFADVKSHAKNHGDDVWITAGKDILVIQDMHKSDLDSGDFLF